MKDPESKPSRASVQAGTTSSAGLSPWQQLKRKRIAYLTLPLLIMATVVEAVILATGWKYQQLVCLPQGMGVTFLGIGPIGATILAVELLKLPLAIWTASRQGFAKGFMLVIGLPLICLLTFQLVKDMAVYEMGTAMAPASQMLEKAAAEETRIIQMNGELAAIEGKRADRERKLAELDAKQAKAKAELEESLKFNEAARQDAISLTEYQKKELSEVEARQAAIIQQFATDTEQLTKSIADLRARREAEFARTAKDSANWEARKAAYDADYAKWHTEEARIDNVHKTAMAEYSNQKSAYQKDKAEYEAASFLKRQLMKEPVDPGVPPVREVNKFPKPAELDGRPSALVAEIDAQIKAKEAELLLVNNKRRDRIAQVDTDARRLREEFDRRSSTKREETDRKREELTAALAALAKQGTEERGIIEKEFESVVQKVDSIRAEIDAARKRAEGYYEAREAAIRTTQVHRIATTVEIVRGLIMGERPMSIKASAKERGDVLTDQISMVRIWVYPVLAFIVAFLPTLMVEIGFSTVFEPEQHRRPYRVGFFGRRLHWLYTRAGRHKILRAERLANEATAQIATRDKAVAEANAKAEAARLEKESALKKAQEEVRAAAAKQEEHLREKEQEFVERSKKQEAEWVAKLAGTADSLNRAIVEKDALRDLQKSEIERQIQLRQNAWSDRLTQLRQELDDQRATAEAERTALMAEHHKKLMEVSEECKTQVLQARRQVANADLATVEKTARLENDLKASEHAREAAEAQLKQQADSFSLKLAQVQEDAARDLEKAGRQEKHRSERQNLEFEKTLRQREDEFERRLAQREQELSLAFDARLAEEKSRAEQDARARVAELENQLEVRSRAADATWKQELQQREDVAQSRLKQREQQLQAQAEARVRDLQTQAEQELRRREADLERELEVQAREADRRLKQELQQQESAFQAKLKQREQELAIKGGTREAELHNQWTLDLRAREDEWERQTEARIRATETRLDKEAQQKEELFLSKSRQRDQQWQMKLDALRAEMHAQGEESLRRHQEEASAGLRTLETQMRKEMQEKEEAAQAKARQREQDLISQVTAQAESRQQAAQTRWEGESEKRTRAAMENLVAQLERAEKERNEAQQFAADSARKVQHLEKKLTEVSSFLNDWRNGARPGEVTPSQPGRTDWVLE